MISTMHKLARYTLMKPSTSVACRGLCSGVSQLEYEKAVNESLENARMAFPEFEPVFIKLAKRLPFLDQGQHSIRLCTNLRAAALASFMNTISVVLLLVSIMAGYLDTFPEKYAVTPEYDITFSMGVLTAIISKKIGTYVINKQSPNKQIWLSSPVSGPKRYDLINGRWVYTHDNESLDQLLSEEFQKHFNTKEIDFKDHI